MRPLRQVEWVLLALAVVGIIAFIVVWELSDDPDAGDTAYRRGDYETAAREWHALADKGDAASQNKLAQSYESGKGVSKNDIEAAKWYGKAAAQGIASAQSNLADMYKEGRGVGKKYAEAVKWYGYAAEQGYAPAQNNLGAMLHAGLGIPVDSVRGLMWLEIAATQGNKSAARNRDRTARNMSAGQIDKAKHLARQWLEKHGKAGGSVRRPHQRAREAIDVGK